SGAPYALSLGPVGGFFRRGTHAAEQSVKRLGPFQVRDVDDRHDDHLTAYTSSRRTSSSANCTVFSAAPFSRLSPVTQKFSACGSCRSNRTRPTAVSSRPAHSRGVGACSTTRFGNPSMDAIAS